MRSKKGKRWGTSLRLTSSRTKETEKQKTQSSNLKKWQIFWAMLGSYFCESYYWLVLYMLYLRCMFFGCMYFLSVRWSLHRPSCSLCWLISFLFFRTCLVNSCFVEIRFCEGAGNRVGGRTPTIVFSVTWYGDVAQNAWTRRVVFIYVGMYHRFSYKSLYMFFDDGSHHWDLLPAVIIIHMFLCCVYFKKINVCVWCVILKLYCLLYTSRVPSVNVKHLFSIVTGLTGCLEFNDCFVCCLYQNFYGTICHEYHSTTKETRLHYFPPESYCYYYYYYNIINVLSVVYENALSPREMDNSIEIGQ